MPVLRAVENSLHKRAIITPNSVVLKAGLPQIRAAALYGYQEALLGLKVLISCFILKYLDPSLCYTLRALLSASRLICMMKPMGASARSIVSSPMILKASQVRAG